MVLHMGNKLFKIISKYKFIILITLFSILFLALSFWLYEDYSRYYVIAKFRESGPLFVNMPVYYKGYKIGKTRRIELSKNYKYTFVKIVFRPKHPTLSEDIVAKVKELNEENDYIDLVLHDDASNTSLKKGEIIEGEGKFDVDTFLSEIADSGLIIPLIQTFSETLVNISHASNEVKGFFTDSRLILRDNRRNIEQTTRGLS